MPKSEKPIRLEDIELYPDAMDRTERAIKAAFQTGHVSKGAVKRTVAVKPKTKRATHRR